MPILRDHPQLWTRFERLSRHGEARIESVVGGWEAHFIAHDRTVSTVHFQDADLLTVVALLVRRVEAVYPDTGVP